MSSGWLWCAHVGSLIVTNAITLVGDAGHGDSCEGVEAGGTWELCTFLSILLWTSKALKNSLLKYMYIFTFLRFYLFIVREEKGGRKRGKETLTCGCLSCALPPGTCPQLGRVPWLGIERATLCFAGRHSIRSATPARAKICVYI